MVTEWTGNRVTVFSPNGERLRSFGTKGFGKGQFLGPQGVAVDDKGSILVADTVATIAFRRFTAQGKFLKAVDSQSKGPLQFDYPTGIAFNASNGRVYVADDNDHVF